MIYGYCRISTKKQNIERQVRNIKDAYPDATIISEAYTGTTLDRPLFDKMLKTVKTGDTIVFDSVSRMSRNAEEGTALYQELFNKGVNLVFLKEHYIDTDTYKTAMETGIKLTGTDVDFILKGVNQYLAKLAQNQIRIAFDQSEKEVLDLRQRTREGIATARLNGEQIGHVTGTKLTTKKSLEAKEGIKRLSKTFNGSNTDAEVIKLLGISRNSYYKYKRELQEEGQ